MRVRAPGGQRPGRPQVESIRPLLTDKLGICFGQQWRWVSAVEASFPRKFIPLEPRLAFSGAASERDEAVLTAVEGVEAVLSEPLAQLFAGKFPTSGGSEERVFGRQPDFVRLPRAGRPRWSARVPSMWVCPCARLGRTEGEREYGDGRTRGTHVAFEHRVRKRFRSGRSDWCRSRLALHVL